MAVSETPNIPEDYPGLAQSDDGMGVSGLETTPLEGGEHLLSVRTDHHDTPLRLVLTPTQVRQWSAELNICEWRVNVAQAGKPDLEDTVLISTLGKSFHMSETGACAAVNAYDTAIDRETTVREAIEEGYQPCHHCYDFDGWDPADLQQEVMYLE